jgi:methylenetetrahydrofolate reductase (NADPH)
MSDDIETRETDDSDVRLSWPRTFRSKLAEPGSFVRVVELVTTRGLLTEPSAARVVSTAMQLTELRIADALSITDNAGGHPKIAPESLGSMLLEHAQDVIIHLTCKDLNRNGLESRAWTLADAGFYNLLCLSGDHPVDGYMGQPGAVFDVDSVGLLHMLRDMNEGLLVPKPRGGEPARLPPTDLFLGATVSPFKLQEGELIPQYLKLEAKIANGAEFIITQVGYDSRKLDELLRYMEMRAARGDAEARGRGDTGTGGGGEGSATHEAGTPPLPSAVGEGPGEGFAGVPVIANVCVLSSFLARHFNRGAVPGVIVSDDLLALAERQAASQDKGKAFFHELAAKQIAVARGLGCRGAYLTGRLTPAEVKAIFDKADSFGSDDWRLFAREIQFPQPGEFYFFEQDGDSGLNSREVNHAYVASLTPRGRTGLRSTIPASYRFSRLLHDHLFDSTSQAFKAGHWFYSGVDGRATAKRWLHAGEQAAKIGIFDCRDCGDCSLPDTAYLCPESQCAKNQRNGPCGGTHQGLCEVLDKECIWARAYDRLKPYGEEQQMLDRPPVYRDGSLKGTSAWANTFLGRDHHAIRRRG